QSRETVSLTTARDGFQLPQPATNGPLHIETGLVNNVIAGYQHWLPGAINARQQERLPTGAVKMRQAHVPAPEVLRPADSRIHVRPPQVRREDRLIRIDPRNGA